MRVYLFRHGETDWNVTRRVQGMSDIPLNENGIAQAREVAQKIAGIRFDAAYASTLGRARQTAEILLGIDGTPDAAGSAEKGTAASEAAARKHDRPTLQLDARLAEFNFGKEEGDDLEHIVSDEHDPLHDFILAPDQYIPPEGAESIDDVWLRMKSFFEEVLVPLEREAVQEEPEEREHNVLIVSHGGTIRALTCHLADRPYTQFWGPKKMTNLALNLLEIRDGEIRLIEEAREMLD